MRTKPRCFTSNLPLPSRSEHTKVFIGSNSIFFSFSYPCERKTILWSHLPTSVATTTTVIAIQTPFERTTKLVPSLVEWKRFGAEIVSFQTYGKANALLQACTNGARCFTATDRRNAFLTEREPVSNLVNEQRVKTHQLELDKKASSFLKHDTAFSDTAI